MAQLLAQAQQLQQQLAQAQEELARTRVDGSAGGGLVTATVMGSGELVDLTISPQAIEGSDAAEAAETVADLVLAAVRDATSNVADLQQQALGPLSQGLGALGGGLPGTPGAPGLPGL
ncbi:YbaB/EbfC family nucleoid-associated protein [Vallicoccus soli]